MNKPKFWSRKSKGYRKHVRAVKAKRRGSEQASDTLVIYSDIKGRSYEWVPNRLSR